MPAPKNNQFWKARCKHGRDKIFETPAVLLESCSEYLEWCDKNPLLTVEYNGKDAKKCTVPKMRAYTLSGLFVFLDIDRKTWDLYRQREDFIPVTTHVEQIIYTQKFEGAAAGLLNASIIARDLGLKEQTDVTSKGEKISTPTDLSRLPLELLLQIEKHLSDGNAG